MSNDSSISLVNLGKLSKPADTLIKKVPSAVGGIFEPWHIKRVAKAKAEASLIKAKSEIELRIYTVVRSIALSKKRQMDKKIWRR